MAPHHLASFRYVAEFFGKIQQSDVVCDDSVVSIQQGNHLLFGFNEMVCTFIKTGNPHFFNQCVRSGLNYYS